jgi:hypothetical protein
MRIAMVTHVPFWQRTTGAMQRMWSISEFLMDRGHAFQVFFVGDQSQVPTDDFTSFSVTAAYQKRSNFLFGSLGKLFGKSDRSSNSSVADVEPNIAAMSLEDFQNQAAINSFAKFIERNDFDVVIFEYIAMSYLARWLKSNHPEIRTIVDTHDVISQRHERFESFGHGHWLNVSAQQEAEALHCYDAILAIQDREAGIFQHMAPTKAVIVAGHAVAFDQLPGTVSKSSFGNARPDCFTLGFLGSRNQANADAIEWFVDNCWPQLVESLGGSIRLLIVGAVSELIRDDLTEIQNIQIEPETRETSKFYSRINIAINPVRFGTGLKIKNVEAILLGIPLVTTEHGIEGFQADIASGVATGNTPTELISVITALIGNYEKSCADAKILQSIAAEQFSSGTVYAEFNNWLQLMAK